MKNSLLEFRREGIYCPKGGFFIDPFLPVDYAVITHAHGDHARWGMRHYLCHEYSEPILKIRIGPDISVQSIKYGEKIKIGEVIVSLHPAGHIIGSSQIRIEYKGQIAVCTGDYKIQDDGLSTPFEPIKCHEIVTESTFGLPIYRWKTPEENKKEIQKWVASNRENGQTSVLFGYSLGKAQRLLTSVAGIAPVYVHSSIYRLHKAFREIGISLPEDILFNSNQAKGACAGDVVIFPPAMFGTNVTRRFANSSMGLCSGWMQVRGNRRWKSADAGFVISDHADWDGLLQAIRSSEAEHVYVTHGYTETFSRFLNEIGISASVVPDLYSQRDNEDDELS